MKESDSDTVIMVIVLVVGVGGIFMLFAVMALCYRCHESPTQCTAARFASLLLVQQIDFSSQLVFSSPASNFLPS